MALVSEVRVASWTKEEGTAQATVIIFDGDPIVGRALEMLLRTAGYVARYVFDGPSEALGSLEGVRVVLLGPGWDAESHEALIKALGGAPGLSSMTILQLGDPSDGARVEPGRHVPWPCRAEDLTRRIDDALLTKTGPETDDAQGKGAKP